MTIFRIVIVALAVFILITAFARLQDVMRKKGRRWILRKIGLSSSIVAMLMVIGSNFTTYAAYWLHITVLLALSGWALTWLTTPNEKPWWELVSRYDPRGDD